MAECPYTCFDRVMNVVKPLPKEKLDEACDIVQNFSLIDLLDFGVENDSFSAEQGTTLYEGIIMWEDLVGNYYEEDHEKLMRLYDALGITKEVFDAYIEAHKEQ